MQITTLPCGGNSLHQCAGKHGCAVTVTGRRLNVLTDAQNALRASGVEVLGLQGDVRSADDCAQWVQQTLGAFGQLHILVNCAAGVAASGTSFSALLFMCSLVAFAQVYVFRLFRYIYCG
jgi:NAD(P)-dependent dehydrogenase (short-subunit alcohol dehydrogenase family)